MSSEKKLWGGRFKRSVNSELNALNQSLSVDKRLWEEDVAGSVAYAKSLQLVGILTKEEFDKIRNGLEIVKSEWETGSIRFQESDEDVHTVNERRLTELIGDVGGKLHTGRSRNDQVATDMKLWMKKATESVKSSIENLCKVIVDRSEELIDVLLPGYTHLQRAQVVRFSHWLLSYGFALVNDYSRLENLYERLDYSPLGSGAIAGNPFGIDRQKLAQDLGLQHATPNSMFAVGDRDFVVEFNFVASLLGVHLSRLAEDMILYCSKEFGFISLADEFSTGSSLMPQKRNPDSLELVRGISGEVFGQLCGFMMSLKGLPSTYNKDLQSDKISMFLVYDRITAALNVITGALKTLEVNKGNCLKALTPDMLATDLAYYLVRKGMPFRKAHHVVGDVVRLAEERNVPINSLPWNELSKINPLFSEDVSKIWNFEASVEQYSVEGGTAKRAVQEQIQKLKKIFIF